MSRAALGQGMTSARTRARMVERLQQQGIKDKGVLAAINKVERHLFVDEAFAHRAYEDTALPLGLGQTISQPFIVARMIECLRAGDRPLGKTLEIGTGCGYQASVLAGLTKEVYSIERLAGLIERAKLNLRAIKCFNVRLKHGDGYLGIPEVAPSTRLFWRQRHRKYRKPSYSKWQLVAEWFCRLVHQQRLPSSVCWLLKEQRQAGTSS